MPVIPTVESPSERYCLAQFAAWDAANDESVPTPSSPAAVPGFPYYRVDRFLASLNPTTRAEKVAWLEALSAADAQVRAVQATVDGSHSGYKPLSATLNRCRSLLLAADLADPQRFAALRQRSQVADEYLSLYRALGFYVLTVEGVKRGIQQWQAETRAIFAEPLASLPISGRLQRWQPPMVEDTSWVPIQRDALDIPRPTANQWRSLIHRHAPIWEVDIATAADRIGQPYIDGQGLPTVAAAPVTYVYPSYIEWQGQPLLQINYQVWFAARPAQGAVDILAGRLDGLLWRVTLDTDAEPLIYDSIHPCGCYHLFFPTSALTLRQEAISLPEPPLVPSAAPTLMAGQRVLLRIAAGSHYLQRVYGDHPSGAVYRLRPYESLYQTPTPAQAVNPFDTAGLLDGSERLERFILWPMGIASPGAMRERGRHATAFAGKRHFDDPDLLEHLFEPYAFSK